jgi:hypothetical protein
MATDCVRKGWYTLVNVFNMLQRDLDIMYSVYKRDGGCNQNLMGHLFIFHKSPVSREPWHHLKHKSPEDMFTRLDLRAKILATHRPELHPPCEVTAIRCAPPALAPQPG